MVKRKDYLVNNSKTLRIKQTRWESKLWTYLRAGRLESLKFKRQVPIGQFIVDFCCNQRKLIIELDGSHHVGSQTDAMRDKFFNDLGYKVLRFWNNEVDDNFEGVLAEIYKSLKL